jgi:DNA mismatch endonuclease Vsr
MIRNKNMQAVKSTGSKIETTLMRALWQNGIRYRKNYKNIFGKPDIVFIGKKVAVFCDSEFWHGKDWEKRKNDHKTNVEFWHKKIERNIERDKEVNEFLLKNGWQVIRFWGEEIENDVLSCVQTILKALNEKKTT